MLKRTKPTALKGDLKQNDYALLVDRVAMLRHKPLSYGSQFVCKAHH